MCIVIINICHFAVWNINICIVYLYGFILKDSVISS